jgi:hypothetical protein
MSDEKKDIFISYSHNDSEFVHRIIDDLKAKGLDLWFDEQDVPPGANLTKSVDEGLSGTRYMLLFLSTNAIKSKWVEEEWTAKYKDEIERNKVSVIPILIENIEIKELPLIIRNKKIVDFSKEYKQELDKTADYLLKDLRSQKEKKSLDSLKETMINDVISKRKSLLQHLCKNIMIRVERAKEKKWSADRCLKIIFQEIEFKIKKYSGKVKEAEEKYNSDPAEFNTYYRILVTIDYDDLIEFKEKLEFIKNNETSSEAILDQILLELEITQESNFIDAVDADKREVD